MAETISQLLTGPSAFLSLPGELINQIVGELSDKHLGDLRVTSKYLRDITLVAWKNRALGDKFGRPALEWAAEYNIPSLIDYLLMEFPDTEINNSRGRKCRNLLCIACGLGNNEAVLALITHGADVNYDPGRGSALLHAVHGGHDITIQMLLERNADPYALDSGDSNIVHIAARNNHVQTLRLILSLMKADPESMPGINDFNAAGFTALHLASEVGAVGAAELLLESGADIDRTCDTAWRETPLARTVRVSLSGTASMATLLLSRGANIEGRTAESQDIPNFTTPLHNALQRNSTDSYEIASLLIAHGAALNTLDDLGCPTMILALYGKVKIPTMRLIVDGGGDINMVDNNGLSVLHWLARLSVLSYTRDMLCFLQEKGADMFLMDNSGMTPRDYAENGKWGHELIEATWGDDD